MIIDNNSRNNFEKPKLANHIDTTVNQVIKVQHEADNTLLELATNLETLKNLYHNRNTFEDFTKVAERLLKDNYDGKNSLDILYENKDFIYNEETIKLLKEVSNSLVEINLVSQNLTNIDLSNANIDIIKEVLPSLFDIELTAKSITDIQRIARNIEKVIVLHTHIIKIITLFDSINELHTIYNYLPYLLKLAAFLNNYTQMIKMIVSRFDYYGEILDNHILEFMEANRHITYHLNEHNKEIVKTRTDFEKIREEIIKFKEEINNTVTEIKEIVKEFDKEALNQLKELIIELTKRVEKLEKTGGGTGGTTYDDTEIRNLINEIKNKLANLKQSVETNTNKITNIENNINNINKEIVEIKNKNVIIEAGKNITIDKTDNKYVINATTSGGGTTITQELNYTNFTL